MLALLSDSANADSKIQVASEQEVGDAILDTIADWDGRVIVAAVASNLSRIQQVFDAAAETGRRVVLTGFDVEKHRPHSHPLEVNYLLPTKNS